MNRKKFLLSVPLRVFILGAILSIAVFLLLSLFSGTEDPWSLWPVYLLCVGGSLTLATLFSFFVLLNLRKRIAEDEGLCEATFFMPTFILFIPLILVFFINSFLLYIVVPIGVILMQNHLCKKFRTDLDKSRKIMSLWIN